MHWLWVQTDWSDPFPLETLNKCAKDWGGEIFVTEATMANDGLNWVFSDYLLTEDEATDLLKRSLDNLG